MKLKTLLSILIAFLFLSVNGQNSLVIYETYEDFTNNNGTEIKGDFVYLKTEESFGKLNTSFKNKDKSSSKENSKIKIDGKQTWGFKLNDVLFRFYKGGPQWVAIEGELIYYENGIIKLFNLKTGKENAPYWEGYGAYCGVSKNLNSEFVSITPGVKLGKSYQKELKKFVENNPECDNFVNCVFDKHTYVRDIRRCAEKFTNIKVSK